MDSAVREVRAEAIVVGAGPAGLSAAAELRRRGLSSVMVLEREVQAGGIPRHSEHTGYGLRDRRSLMTGPAYARALVEEAEAAGVELRTEAMVTGWSATGALQVTSPRGRLLVSADALVLATGARERPRSARMVPGDRPDGVLTTGALQNLVQLKHPVGASAIVVGSGLVSWSAVLTLREAGCRTALMVTTLPHVESPLALVAAGRTAFGFPIARRTRVTRIIGRDRVEAVEVEHLGTGRRARVPCDTVVFTGDWVPDNELCRLHGLQMDAGHRGPVVDTALRTSHDGIFAAGNLLHPVDTADVAALDGRHVAGQVIRWLAGAARPSTGVRIVAGEPFAWVAPGVLRPGDPAPPRGRLLLWPQEHQALPRVVAEQGGHVIGRRRLPWPAAPGRVFRVPWSVVAAARQGDGDVALHLA